MALLAQSGRTALAQASAIEQRRRWWADNVVGPLGSGNRFFDNVIGIWRSRRGERRRRRLATVGTRQIDRAANASSLGERRGIPQGGAVSKRNALGNGGAGGIAANMRRRIFDVLDAVASRIARRLAAPRAQKSPVGDFCRVSCGSRSERNGPVDRFERRTGPSTDPAPPFLLFGVR